MNENNDAVTRGVEKIRKVAESGPINDVARQLIRNRDLAENLDMDVFNPVGLGVASVLSLQDGEADAFDRELTLYTYGAKEKRDEHIAKMRQIIES